MSHREFTVAVPDETFQIVLTLEFRESDSCLRIPSTELRNQIDDRPRGQCRESHDVEATDDGAIGCRQLFSRRSYVSQNLSTRADQAATGRTEHHSAPDAMEKPHSQFTFEPAQRL